MLHASVVMGGGGVPKEYDSAKLCPNTSVLVLYVEITSGKVAKTIVYTESPVT